MAEMPGFDVEMAAQPLCYQRILLRNKNGCGVWRVVGYSCQKEMVGMTRCSGGLVFLYKA